MTLTIGVTGPDKETQTAAAETLIAALTKRGYAVGAIKSHAHGDFDLDRPGKASYRHRAAGARETVLTSPTMLACIRYRDADPKLPEAVVCFGPEIEMIVTDGFAQAADIMVTAPIADLDAVVNTAVGRLALSGDTSRESGA